MGDPGFKPEWSEQDMVLRGKINIQQTTEPTLRSSRFSPMNEDDLLGKPSKERSICHWLGRSRVAEKAPNSVLDSDQVLNFEPKSPIGLRIWTSNLL